MTLQTLKILIADDEAPARNRLRELLGDIENIEIVAEAKNGKEAIDLAESLEVHFKPDVMLLDIRMPVMDGIEAAQHAQKIEPKPHIIFTTAFDAYAIKAFDLNAIDYLLKPIRLERLQTAINKAHALQPNNHAALQPLQNLLKKSRSHLSIHERGRVLLVPIEIGESIQLNNVFFVQSKSVLMPESYPELDRLVQIMKDNVTIEIELDGHTEGRGDPKANIALSEVRVEAVKEYLVSKGVSGKRIVGKGYGGAKPMVSNDTEENRQLNRRVEFKITKK